MGLKWARKKRSKIAKVGQNDHFCAILSVFYFQEKFRAKKIGPYGTKNFPVRTELFSRAKKTLLACRTPSPPTGVATDCDHDSTYPPKFLGDIVLGQQDIPLTCGRKK